MGDINRVLSKVKLDTVPFFQDSVRMEVAEAIHVHWRDLRILMSPVQARAFLDSSIKSEIVWDGNLSQTDKVLDNKKLDTNIIFGDEGKVEELKDGNIHVHWRDLRLELTVKDFISLCTLLHDARCNIGETNE